MDTIDFAPFFNEKLKAKGLTLKKLSDMSGIPLKHLQSLSTGSYADLPPAPYLRGYLLALGPILNFDGAAAWEHFRAASAPIESGRRDALPVNRFASRISKTPFVLVIAAVLLLGYVGFRFASIFGQPVIHVDDPTAPLVHTTVDSLLLRGRLENGDALFLNGETVALQEGGAWQRTVSLEPGLNIFQLSAKKFLGGETQVLRQVVYEPPTGTPSPSTTVPGAPETPSAIPNF